MSEERNRKTQLGPTGKDQNPAKDSRAGVRTRIATLLSGPREAEAGAQAGGTQAVLTREPRRGKGPKNGTTPRGAKGGGDEL